MSDSDRPETGSEHLPRAVLVDGCRTPFQRVGTGFRDLMSYQLAAAAIEGLLRRTGVEGKAIDRVVLGATVSNPRTTNVAREAALTAGLPPTVPAITLTAAGTSALAAISHGLDLIATGQAQLVIAGGTDCVSDPPILFRRAMRQKLLGARRLKGFLPTLRFLASLRPWDFLPDMPDITEFTTGMTMGEFSEELAARLGVDRGAQDAYALASHRAAAAARDAGYLAAEIVPVVIPEQGVEVGEDNGIRDNSSLEQLSRLRPAFAKTGTLTAGNSSFLTDGAAVVLLAGERRARGDGLPRRARFLASVLTAHDPRDELLLGPVYATPRVLQKAGLSFEDLDVFEIHEAFAAQILAVLACLASDDFARQHLGLEERVGEVPREKLNAWGGSLALGNPFAPNGARLVTTAANRLHREGGRYGLVTTCAGGGLGQAMVLERLP